MKKLRVLKNRLRNREEDEERIRKLLIEGG